MWTMKYYLRRFHINNDFATFHNYEKDNEDHPVMFD